MLEMFRENWLHYVVDFSAICFGVTLSFMLNDWREDSAIRELERESLEIILEDLKQDSLIIVDIGGPGGDEAARAKFRTTMQELAREHEFRNAVILNQRFKFIVRGIYRDVLQEVSKMIQELEAELA